MKHEKDDVNCTWKDEKGIINLKLLSVEYDAKIKKYIFTISYFEGKTPKITIKKYKPLINYLYNTTSKWKAEKDILSQYGLKKASNIDLNLYIILKHFDRKFNTNYAKECAEGNFSPKLIYNFSKERKGLFVNFSSSRKMNKYMHNIAEKQKKFNGAKIIKSRKFLQKTVAATIISLVIGIFVNPSKKGTNTKEMNQVTIETEKKVAENKVEAKNIKKKNIQNTSYVNGETSVTSVNGKVKDPEELIQKEYVKRGNDLDGFDGYALGDEIELKGQKFSKQLSPKFGKQSYISCDELDYDYYRISEIVAFRNDEVLDRINLTTEEKYNIKTNELYSMYGSEIQIAYNFYGYKKTGENKESKKYKIYKNLGYINSDRLVHLSEKDKKSFAKNYEQNKLKIIKKKNKF